MEVWLARTGIKPVSCSVVVEHSTDDLATKGIDIPLEVADAAAAISAESTRRIGYAAVQCGNTAE